MKRRTELAVGEYYHLYSRGVNKMIIFADLNDYERFQRLLYLSNRVNNERIHNTKWKEVYQHHPENRLVNIGSYCLMPNHFHILVKEIREGGTSLFMKKVLTAYSMYFNHKYERTGILFESRFKSKHAGSDKYLKYLHSYICLNPVKLVEPYWKKKGISNPELAKKYLNNYKYSSYLDHLGSKRVQNLILSTETFPEYFNTKQEFEQYNDEWLTFIKDQADDKFS